MLWVGKAGKQNPQRESDEPYVTFSLFNFIIY